MSKKMLAALYLMLLAALLTSFPALAAELPVFSQPSGRYEDSVTVEIIPPTEGATIIYTLDGSIPTIDNAQIYGEPLVFTESAVLRAACLVDGAVSDEIASASYIFSDSTLAIVSLIIDPDELWNEKNGIFAEGDQIVKKNGIPFQNAVYAKVAGQLRDGRAIYIAAGTSRAAFNEAVQVCTVDGYSLYNPQKTLEVYAVDGSFTTTPFDNSIPGAVYGSFVLSNMENDGYFTRTVENLLHALITEHLHADVLLLEMKPVAVFINGEYWGHYNLEETWDVDTIARRASMEGLITESIEIAQCTFSGRETGSEAFTALQAVLERMSPNDTADDLAYLDEQIDIDSFLDCLALVCFFGEQNPGSSIAYYKVPDGKWKCALTNNDLTLFQSSYNAVATYTNEDGMGILQLDNTIFLKILEVDEYRDLFLTKLGTIYQTLTTEVMQAELDACVAQLLPEIPAHLARWAPYMEETIIAQMTDDPNGAITFWNQRIDRLRNGTIVRRHYYVYTHTQETFLLTDEEMLRYFGGPAPVLPAN